MPHPEKSIEHNQCNIDLKNVFDCVITVDKDGKIIGSHVQDGGKAYCSSETESVFEIVNRKDCDAARQLISDAVSSPGRVVKGRIRLRNPDGGSSWFDANLCGSSDAQTVSIFANDITEQVRSKSFAEIVEKTVSIGSWELEFSGGKALYFSPNVYRIFGMANDRKLANVNDMIGLFSGVEKKALTSAAEELLKHGTPFDLTLKVTDRAGAEKIIRIDADAEKYDGVISRVYGTCRDVTGQVSRERVLAWEKQKAEAANKTKSQFLANMSHEIRTPLNGVLGVASLLSATELSKEQREMLLLIRESGDLLLSVLNDILDLSKVESGHLELEARPFKICSLVNRLRGVYEMKAKEKGIYFLAEFDCDDSNMRRGDENRILQVLHNILSNAVKFTERGQVFLRVRNTPEEPLLISIKDTGIGMGRDQLSRLFEPFMQADYSTTRKYGGTGLGMTIARNFIEKMDGTISVQSETGQGTEVEISIPLPVEASNAAPVKDQEDWQGNFEGCRVLVAEDNRTNQVVLGSMLRKLGVTADIVSNGQEAVEASTSQDYGVLMLDYSMPVLNGVDALRTIRAAEAAKGRPRTPAVVCTANTLSYQVEEYLREGFDFHLAKPLTMPGIKKILAQTCSAGRVERSA